MLYRDLVTGDRVVYEREGVYVKGTVASPYTITPPFKPIYISPGMMMMHMPCMV